MSNTLTSIAPVLYSAAREVANEPAGMLNAINMNFDSKGVAKGDSVKVPVAPTRATSDFTPAATSTAGTDAIASSVSVTIDASKKVSWHLDGEQIRSLENGGNYEDWVKQMIAQGMRALRNGAETAAWTAAYKASSRGTGTAGTTPFASTLGDLTAARKILQDNGAPMADLQCVIDTAAGVKLRNLGVYQNAYQAGDASQLRQGSFSPMFGFNIRESSAVGVHTKGTAASYAIDLVAGYDAGTTTFHVDTGTGTILAGDVISNTQSGRDSNLYIVSSGFAGDGDGDVSIGAPGTRVAWVNNDTVAVGNSYTANLAFERSAIVGVCRPPIIPANATISQMEITDASGLTYLLLDIQQYGMRTWELHLAYGFKAVNPEFIATILG